MLTWPVVDAATLGGSITLILLFAKLIPGMGKGIGQSNSVIGGEGRTEIQFFCSKLCFFPHAPHGSFFFFFWGELV